MSTKNKLWPADVALFESMAGNYVSENERFFFETLKDKEENLFTCAGELFLFETDTPDLIYFVRYDYDEFVVGHGTEGHYSPEHHVQCLADALNANLKELGYIDRDITFLEWLRERDYSCIRYDHNYDDL
ncbi:MAG: hypothetical protein ACI35Q_10120 [Marinilabiliaceae bacterium]